MLVFLSKTRHKESKHLFYVLVNCHTFKVWNNF